VKLDVRPITFSEADFEPILAEAEQAGGAFMLRVRDEWLSGVQRFDGPGEFLLGAFHGGGLVGVGGVSADPYDAQQGLGRVRHIYVLKRLRGTGIGRDLMDAIMLRSRPHWRVLRLRTKEAGPFYEKPGFVANLAENETHRLVL